VVDADERATGLFGGRPVQVTDYVGAALGPVFATADIVRLMRVMIGIDPIVFSLARPWEHQRAGARGGAHPPRVFWGGGGGCGFLLSDDPPDGIKTGGVGCNPGR
jgi:hypothetical protein